jgi:hypothetical protein
MGDYFATTGLDFFFAGPLDRVSLITDSAPEGETGQGRVGRASM